MLLGLVYNRNLVNHNWLCCHGFWEQHFHTFPQELSQNQASGTCKCNLLMIFVDCTWVWLRSIRNECFIVNLWQEHFTDKFWIWHQVLATQWCCLVLSYGDKACWLAILDWQRTRFRFRLWTTFWAFWPKNSLVWNKEGIWLCGPQMELLKRLLGSDCQLLCLHLSLILNPQLTNHWLWSTLSY